MTQFDITINLGLVSLACKREVATVPKAPSLSNLCVGQPGKPAHEATPLVAPSRCPQCEEITDKAVLKKGLKVGKVYQIIDQDAVADAKHEANKAFQDALTLVRHPRCDVEANTTLGKGVYYITPSTPAQENQYQLLVETLKADTTGAYMGMYALTKASVPTRFRLVLRDDTIVMQEVIDGANFKPAPAVGGAADPNMLKMLLEMVVPQCSAPYSPIDYADTYAAKLDALAAAADVVAVGTPSKADQPAATSTDQDLLAKLEALKAKVAA